MQVDMLIWDYPTKAICIYIYTCVYVYIYTWAGLYRSLQGAVRIVLDDRKLGF